MCTLQWLILDCDFFLLGLDLMEINPEFPFDHSQGMAGRTCRKYVSKSILLYASFDLLGVANRHKQSPVMRFSTLSLWGQKLWLTRKRLFCSSTLARGIFLCFQGKKWLESLLDEHENENSIMRYQQKAIFCLLHTVSFRCCKNESNDEKEKRAKWIGNLHTFQPFLLSWLRVKSLRKGENALKVIFYMRIKAVKGRKVIEIQWKCRGLRKKWGKFTPTVTSYCEVDGRIANTYLVAEEKFKINRRASKQFFQASEK